MKVVIANSLYPPYNVGGAERSVAALAAGLARAGDRVAAVSFAEVPEPTCAEEQGVRVHRIPLRNFYWPWSGGAKPMASARLAWHSRDMWNAAAAQDLGAILEEERPDVLHVNTMAGFSPSIWAEAKKRGIPIVQTLRDYGLLCSRATLFRAGKVCESRCVPCRALTATRHSSSHSPDFIVSNSQFVIEEHRRQGMFRDTAAEVIFNIAGADLPKVQRPSFDEEPDLVFGYVGRIEPEKGIEVVLEAARRLPPSGWRLKIAGRGEPRYVERMKERSRPLPVDWVGFVTPREFYADVDTVLVSSIWHEPLPRTLIESYVAGRSTICSTAGGIPEIAALGPVTSSYAPTDAEALSKAMKAALADRERWRFGATAMELPRDFSEADVVTRYRNVFRRVIDGATS